MEILMSISMILLAVAIFGLLFQSVNSFNNLLKK
jgi:hypothetical protein